jgi:hypothetical protein
MVEGRGELSLALRHPDDQLDAAPAAIKPTSPNSNHLRYRIGDLE